MYFLCAFIHSFLNTVFGLNSHHGMGMDTMVEWFVGIYYGLCHPHRFGSASPSEAQKPTKGNLPPPTCLEERLGDQELLKAAIWAQSRAPAQQGRRSGWRKLDGLVGWEAKPSSCSSLCIQRRTRVKAALPACCCLRFLIFLGKKLCLEGSHSSSAFRPSWVMGTVQLRRARTQKRQVAHSLNWRKATENIQKFQNLQVLSKVKWPVSRYVTQSPVLPHKINCSTNSLCEFNFSLISLHFRFLAVKDYTLGNAIIRITYEIRDLEEAGKPPSLRGSGTSGLTRKVFGIADPALVHRAGGVIFLSSLSTLFALSGQPWTSPGEDCPGTGNMYLKSTRRSP